LIRPRALTVAGAAEALATEDVARGGSRGISPCFSIGYRTSFPFHPGARRAPEHLERAQGLYYTGGANSGKLQMGIYIANGSLGFDLAGFSKL